MKTDSFEIFSSELLQEKLNYLSEKSEFSCFLKEQPTIILINLPADFKGEPEVHEDEDDLYVVLEGEAELLIVDKLKVIKKGDIIHIPAKKTHQLKYTKDGIKYLVAKIPNEG